MAMETGSPVPTASTSWLRRTTSNSTVRFLAGGTRTDFGLGCTRSHRAIPFPDGCCCRLRCTGENYHAHPNHGDRFMAQQPQHMQ